MLAPMSIMAVSNAAGQARLAPMRLLVKKALSIVKPYVLGISVKAAYTRGLFLILVASG